MQDEDNYGLFCKKTVGGWIDRVDPSEDPSKCLIQYYKLYSAVHDMAALLNPLKNLWPNYENQSEFIQDYTYTIRASEDTLRNILIQRAYCTGDPSPLDPKAAPPTVSDMVQDLITKVAPPNSISTPSTASHTPKAKPNQSLE